MRFAPSDWPDAMESAALADLRRRIGDFRPELFIVLGSGLAAAAAKFRPTEVVRFDEVSGLPPARVSGHPGKILFGDWHGRATMALQGRIHHYEGHPWEAVTLPVRLAARLGATVAIFSNMSGGLNPQWTPGTIVVVNDHINFMGDNPLRGDARGKVWTETQVPWVRSGPGEGERLPRSYYSPRIGRLLDAAAAEQGIPLVRGVYVAVRGPNYETPAEVRALRILGGDVVGMSTVPEVQMAHFLGMECAVLSIVANPGAGIVPAAIHHEEVLGVAERVSSRLGALLDAVVIDL